MADIHPMTMKMIKAIANRFWKTDYDPTQDLITMFEELADDLGIPLLGDE